MVEFIPQVLVKRARRISEEIEIIQRRWPSQIVIGAGAVSIYDCFPYFFMEAFPSLNEEKLGRFAVAARLYANSIFLHDKLFDQGADQSSTADVAPINALRILAMQWEAYRQLYELFPAQSAFWEDFRTYLSHFARANVQEQRFIRGGQAWGELSEEVALDIVRGKNGVARATIAGLAEMDRNRAPLQPLVEAIDGYNLARQMLDDLIDWEEDLEAGMPSLLLARVLGRRPTWVDERELANLKGEIGRQIFYAGHAKYLMELALSFLDRADRETAEWPNLAWRKVAADLSNECTLLIEDLERIVEENLRRVERQQKFELDLPSPRSAWQEIAWGALAYVVQQWNLGFGEARHIMEFPRELGFGGPQHQRGDVFQRAIIVDALCDADKGCNGRLWPIVEHEVSYLLSRRDPGRCGWRYFPELPELPADADDLAQIIQLLWRCGHHQDIRQHCMGPLSILLEENRHADGSFDTWIIPTSDRSSAERREAEFALKMWGVGPDLDVMANLLYALVLVDRDRYSEQIEEGAEYLVGRQNREGFWSSTWYHGPYYGTYVCLRFLSRVSPQREAVQLAVDFLRRQQKSDGGWGSGELSNALDTSLALLGLANLPTSRPASSENCDLASRALDYLRQCGSRDGSWPKCEFIRMDTGRAVGGPSRVLSYGSKTVTTAFVLKAAVAWHGLVQEKGARPATAP
jgi:squalene-hopene/tetraprenyl-beta-curcumene cyclase